MHVSSQQLTRRSLPLGKQSGEAVRRHDESAGPFVPNVQYYLCGVSRLPGGMGRGIRSATYASESRLTDSYDLALGPGIFHNPRRLPSLTLVE